MYQQSECKIVLYIHYTEVMKPNMLHTVTDCLHNITVHVLHNKNL